MHSRRKNCCTGEEAQIWKTCRITWAPAKSCESLAVPHDVFSERPSRKVEYRLQWVPGLCRNVFASCALIFFRLVRLCEQFAFYKERLKIRSSNHPLETTTTE